MGNRGTVVLVDPSGTPLGTASKLDAHRPPGRLHLAFSVFLYRPDGRTLLQQRAAAKYHFPLAWANACCSHPAPGEDLVASAEARLLEELGVEADLTEVGRFVYRAVCPHSGLVEHELDHVLVGDMAAEPQPDPAEVAAICWAAPAELLGGAGGEGPPEAAVPGAAPSGAAGSTGTLAPWLLPALRIAESGRAGRTLTAF